MSKKLAAKPAKTLTQKEISIALDLAGRTGYDEAFIFYRDNKWEAVLSIQDAQFRVVTERGTVKSWKLLEGAISFLQDMCKPKRIIIRFREDLIFTNEDGENQCNN